MIGDEAKNAPSRLTRIGGLAKQLHDDGFRNSYLSRQLKAFLAAQIRALRGEKTQTAFGKDLGKPQSVVSRLENERLSGLHVQTLIDIAQKLKIGVIIRFVEFTEFLRYTEDYSDQALAPAPYDQGKVDRLARWSESRVSIRPAEDVLKEYETEEAEQLLRENAELRKENNDLKEENTRLKSAFLIWGENFYDTSGFDSGDDQTGIAYIVADGNSLTIADAGTTLKILS